MSNQTIEDDPELGVLQPGEVWSIDNPDTIWKRESLEDDFEDRDYASPIILGEVIGYNGALQYEALWPDWKRPDGTSNTFNNEYVTCDRVVKKKAQKFSEARKRERLKKADESPSIPVWNNPLDAINMASLERQEALQEKLEKLEREKERERRRNMGRKTTGAVAGPNRRNERSDTGPVAVGGRMAVSRAGPSSVTLSTGSRPSSSTLKTPDNDSQDSRRNARSKRSRMEEMDVSETEQDDSSTRVSSVANRTRLGSPMDIDAPPTSSAKGKGRQSDLTADLLSEIWSKEAENCNAAPVIVVSVPGEEHRLPFSTVDEARNFQYLENKYFQDGDYESDPGVILYCQCQSCDDPRHCSCQGESMVGQNDTRMNPDLRDSKRVKFAYTADGRFAFRNKVRDTKVIECNRLCTCPVSCVNRVSQQPRQFPIEVFCTSNARGWGVRSPERIRKGQVLGLYTGNVISIEEAGDLPPSESNYCFDLDWNAGELGAERTVTSKRHGNWTRYINHSCNPNTATYVVETSLVVPYLAFVALCDIPARTEFTFDYNPSHSDGANFTGGKSRSRPKGSTRCRCGSENCRGYIF